MVLYIILGVTAWWFCGFLMLCTALASDVGHNKTTSSAACAQVPFMLLCSFGGLFYLWFMVQELRGKQP